MDQNPRQKIPIGEIARFALATGMRQSEIARICWEDVDERRRTILVKDRKDPRKKDGNHQRVPLIDLTGYDAWALLQARKPSGREPKGRIFPFCARSVGTAFRRACRALEIKDLRFHDLRHEATSRLFEAGLKIEHVALVTGHDAKEDERGGITGIPPRSLIKPDVTVSGLIRSRRWSLPARRWNMAIEGGRGNADSFGDFGHSHLRLFQEPFDLKQLLIRQRTLATTAAALSGGAQQAAPGPIADHIALKSAQHGDRLAKARRLTRFSADIFRQSAQRSAATDNLLQPLIQLAQRTREMLKARRDERIARFQRRNRFFKRADRAVLILQHVFKHNHATGRLQLASRLIVNSSVRPTPEIAKRPSPFALLARFSPRVHHPVHQAANR